MTIWKYWKLIASPSSFSQAGGMSREYLLTDHFISMSVGNTLVLKACGFIEDHQATLLDVTETSLRIRMGHHWLNRILTAGRLPKAMEIDLQIRPLTEQDEPGRFSRQPLTRYCVIDARIAGGRHSWSEREFAEESRRLLWRLRSYFMAC